MKSKSFMLMILSMGFGLIAAIGISQVMGRSQAAAPVVQMGPVLVAADHMDMKTPLTEENVKIENWPASIIPEGALTSIEQIQEMAVLSRMNKGMPIVQASVKNVKEIEQLKIPEGYKVQAIKVSGDDTINGILSPGDKVDVIGLFKKRGSRNEIQTTTRTFMKALRVFSVGNSMSVSQDRQTGSGGSSIVSLLVTEKQSEEIYFVQRTGEIKLVLRGDYVEGDEKVDSIEDIMGFDSDDEQLAEDAGGVQDPSSLHSISNLIQHKTSQMVVWTGNDAQIVTFQHGGIPVSSGGSAGLRDDEDYEDFDDERESAGNNEIDRGLDRDQY